MAIRHGLTKRTLDRLNATPEQRVDIVIARMDKCLGVRDLHQSREWARYKHAYFTLCERIGS